MSSVLTTKLCWRLSPWSTTYCSSTAPFQNPIQVNSTSIEENIYIQEYLNVAISIENNCDFQHSNGKQIAWFPEETLQSVLSISSKLQLPSRNYFKVLITWTAILSVNFNRHCWGLPIFMKSSKLVCRATIFVQTVSFMHKLRMETRQLTVSACPLLWIRWEKLKEIKLNSLAYFSWMCCVVAEFVYANTIILFNLCE